MKKILTGATVFALLWALAFLLPPVREIGRALFFVPTLTGAISLEMPKAKGLPPDNPITIEWNLERQPALSKQQRGASLEILDKLAAQFPDQLWIVAARLRRTVNPPPRFDTGQGTPPALASDWLDAKQIERAAIVASKAGAIEPDNSFWPWMEADFRFALEQNEAAIACIERAGKATRFDDFVQSNLRARLALWEKHDRPTWEEKIATSFGVSLPHLIAMRDVSDAGALEALRARKRGEVARALQIGAAVLDANRVCRRDSRSFIGSLVGEANGYGALEKLLDRPPLKTEGYFAQRPKHGLELQKTWTQFARANGQFALASRADWLLDPSVTENRGDFYAQDLMAGFGLPPAQARLAVLSPLVLCGLATLCFFLAMVWLLGTVWALRGVNGETPSRGQVTACANFGFWALLGALVVAFGTDWLPAMLRPFSSSFYDAKEPPLSLWACAAFALGCWLLPVAFWNWKRERRLRWVRPQREARAPGRGFGRARVFAWLLFLMFAALVASNGTNIWSDTLFPMPVSASLATASLVCAVGLETIRFRRSGRSWPTLQLEGAASPHSALRIARDGAWIVGALCLFLILGALVPGVQTSPMSQMLAVPCGIAAIVLEVAMRRKIGRGDGFEFRLAVRSAGVLALAWSFTAVVLALFVWPLRAELNRQLDRRLSISEMDWMREQITKYPPPRAATWSKPL